MSDTPDRCTISVVVTAYNSAAFIRAALESVVKQSFRDFEMIVVDDGSTDGTGEIVEQYRGPRVSVIRQANQGPAGSLNTGLRMAQGRYIALLDGDDTWHPDKLLLHFEAFEQHPEADLTFSWSDWIDEAGNPVGLHSRRCTGTFGFNSLVEDFVIGNTSSAVIRRSALDVIGLCDPRLSRYYDVDLFLRIALRGNNRVRAVPAVLTYYRRHTGQMSRDWRAMERDWNMLLKKFADRIPGPVLTRAQSNMARYFAFLAYECGQPRESARLLAGNFAAAPLVFGSDLRNWKIAAAVCSALLLPSGWHRRLDRAVRRFR